MVIMMMVVSIPMVVGVIVVMMVVLVHRGEGQPMLFAKLFVTARGIAIAIAGAIFHAAANALHMMVVAFLRLANFGFKPQNLLAIFAHLAVHVVFTVNHFANTVDKGVHHHVMVVQIAPL